MDVTRRRARQLGSEDLLLSPARSDTIARMILVADLEQQLVIAQVRKQSGPRSGEWAARFFQTVAAAVEKAGAEPSPTSR
jgi:hypothetical protein